VDRFTQEVTLFENPSPSSFLGSGLDLGYPRKQASDERNMFVADGFVSHDALR
jgi:hypothetical protein